MRKPGLGRGLGALLDEVAVQTAAAHADAGAEAAPPSLPPGSGALAVPIARIAADPEQPRRRFDAEALTELAGSIRAHGVLQPILVRPAGNGRYIIVAGERRWRAAQQAELHEIPVVVRELDEAAAFEIALIENVQRADLNPIEEASGYARLIHVHGRPVERVARAVGKSRSHVANHLRLLDLPLEVQELVSSGALSMGHARALAAAGNAAALAREAVAGGWSVRRTETAVRKAGGGEAVAVKPAAARHAGGGRDPNLAALEQSMADALGAHVRVVPGAEGPWMGTVEIDYSDLQMLDFVCQRLVGGSGRFDP